jgi:hypothetical protein
VTVLFVEGFSHYRTGQSGSISPGVTDMLAKNWASFSGEGSGGVNAGVLTSSPRFPGTRYLHLGSALGSATRSFVTRSFGNQATPTMGCAVRLDEEDGNLRFGIGTQGLAINPRPTDIRVIGPGGTLFTVPHPGSGLVWNHYELATTIDPVVGTAALYINGVFIHSVAGVNTGTSASVLRFQKTNSVGNPHVTDIYVADERLGDCRVGRQLPSGAGTYTDLAPDPDTNANYQNVNSDTLSDGTRNASATPGAKDTYAIEPLPEGDLAVHAVVPAVRAQKADAGTVLARHLVRTGLVDHGGDDLVLAAGSWQWYPWILSTHPETSDPWTSEDVNALEVGFEVRAE